MWLQQYYMLIVVYQTIYLLGISPLVIRSIMRYTPESYSLVILFAWVCYDKPDGI